ncbi:hypothetical protein KFL_002240190 [Klebsormidium nitens]|uniref:N-acetylgalactosaminide beta-1,3-galactosyltransferase n=1 Tax=Klebsormidium nitens TaxID=105231 RepID=A0A1Y1IAU2_KLENI|nr:hypothetical protein KFL_002240190 [Klebsormidium nitens]|eukprot:GAQ85218.1 hypothetical protein KFL_002240190 [Klebsormidium nitens]
MRASMSESPPLRDLSVWTSIAVKVSRKRGFPRSLSASGRLVHYGIPPLEHLATDPPKTARHESRARRSCRLFWLVLLCVVLLKCLATIHPRFALFGCRDEGAECCSEGNVAERTVYRGGTLADGWRYFLQGGQQLETSLVGPLQVSVPGGSSLLLESNDAFPSIIGVALRLRGSGLSPFELVLHSWDKRRFHVVKGGEVEVRLTEGWAEVGVAFRGLEWQLWAGLEFRNRGGGTALLALDALSLRLPASQQMLESQVAVVQKLAGRPSAVPSPDAPVTLLIGVLSTATESQFRERLVPLYSVLAPHADVIVFVGNSTSNESAHALARAHGGIRLVWLNVSDEYPPRLKDLAMWEYLHQQFQGAFDWFMHLDDDTYVEPGRLRAFLHGFSAAGRSNRPLYVGAPGQGRPSDRQGHKLGLPLGKYGDVIPYCLGGPGYLLNARALAAMGPHVAACKADWASEHSDTEIGRCVARHVGIGCEAEPYTHWDLKKLFVQYYVTGDDGPARKKQGVVPAVLPPPLAGAISLHPVKPRAPGFLTDHVESVRRQMREVTEKARYLYWEDIHLSSLTGFDGLYSSLVCGLTEALFLNRTFVMPSHVSVSGCANRASPRNGASLAHLQSADCHVVPIGEIFDLQSVSVQQRVILSDSAEWAATSSARMEVRPKPGLNRTFVRSVQLAIRAESAPALVRVSANQGNKPKGLPHSALCWGSADVRAVPVAPQGATPKLLPAVNLSNLVASIRKTLGYYDAVRITFENVLTPEGRAALSLLLTSAPDEAANGRRKLFLDAPGLPNLEQLRFGSNVHFFEDFVKLFLELSHNPLSQHVVRQLVVEGGFEQTVLKVVNSTVSVVSSTKVVLQGAGAPKPACHVNPIAVSQDILERRGYSTLFREKLDFRPRECPPESGARGSVKGFLDGFEAYVLTLPGQERWQRVAAAAAAHGIKVSPWYGSRATEAPGKPDYVPALDQKRDPIPPGRPGYRLKPGEVGYLATMRDLLADAQQRRARALLVFDDDALLHQEFGRRLEHILRSSDRCAGFLMEEGRGGILKLGASEWRADTWNWVEDEIQHRVYDASGKLCYNANLRSYGSFAVLYSQHTYQYLIDWANRQLAGGSLPFDHVFKHITLNGTIVRVAYPKLAIMDVAHVSSVDPNRVAQQDREIRHRRHKWNVTLYPETHKLWQRPGGKPTSA